MAPLNGRQTRSTFEAQRWPAGWGTHRVTLSAVGRRASSSTSDSFRRCRRSAGRTDALELKRKCPRCAIVLDDRRLNAGMNCLPHGQVDAYHPPSLCHIGVAGNGHIEAISAALRRDESASLQKTLQVTKKAWSVEEDVHAREGPGVGRRNGERGG